VMFGDDYESTSGENTPSMRSAHKARWMFVLLQFGRIRDSSFSRDATHDFSALPLPAQPAQRRHPCHLKSLPVLASFRHVWGSLGHSAVPPCGFHWGVRQHPLGASNGARPPCPSPVVQVEGSSSLVISSRQQPSTTTKSTPTARCSPGKHHTYRPRPSWQKPEGII
jgi:hypothetical protein